MLIVRANTPRTIERGSTPTLTLEVYDSATSALSTVSSGTVTITFGGRVVVDARAVTPGTPASVALVSADTEEGELSDLGLEVWTLTIGGTVYHFRRPCCLVRHAYYATVVDADLTDRHGELPLSTVLPTGLTTYERYREAAREVIERRLLRMGRRPYLIFDAWALADAHIALTLHLIFLDFFNRLNSDTYKTLADHYAAAYETAFSTVDFRYDSSESGTVDTSATVAAAQGSVVLTAANPGGWWMGGRR